MAPRLEAGSVDCLLSFLCVSNGLAYQVPMDELAALQEGHAFTDVIAHFYELVGFKAFSVALQVIKQAAVGYVFSHYVDRVSL